MNRLSPEKAKAIAAEYMTNGFRKVDALLSLGYKTSYANSKTGLKIYDNVKVKEAIACIAAASKANTNITVESIQLEHENYQRLCEQKGDFATATANLVAKGKTIAAYAEGLRFTDTERQREINADEEAKLRRIADIRLEEELNKKAG